MSKSVSLLSALLCTFIWGTTFIAQDTGMDDIGPFTFNAVRFFVGFLAILPLALLFETKKFKLEFKTGFRYFAILSFLIGLSLFLGSALQQVALLYTDVANAAFFTIFYVPMVPIIIFIFKRDSLHWSVWPSVILCLIGGYLLTNFYDATVRLGDTLVILGALFWSTHIIFTGMIVKKYINQLDFEERNNKLYALKHLTNLYKGTSLSKKWRKYLHTLINSDKPITDVNYFNNEENHGEKKIN